MSCESSCKYSDISQSDYFRDFEKNVIIKNPWYSSNNFLEESLEKMHRISYMKKCEEGLSCRLESVSAKTTKWPDASCSFNRINLDF